MAFPPLVITGDIISASHINAIRNALITWPGGVDAANYTLSNATLQSARIGSTGLEFRNDAGATDQKRWEIVQDAPSGLLLVRAVSDSGAPSVAWVIARTGPNVVEQGFYGNVTFADLIRTPRLFATALPTTAPTAGTKEVWNDGGTLKIA